jgi:hypothetical protein
LEIEDSPMKMKPNNWDKEIEFFYDSVAAVADGLQFLKLNYS